MRYGSRNGALGIVFFATIEPQGSLQSNDVDKVGTNPEGIVSLLIPSPRIAVDEQMRDMVSMHRSQGSLGGWNVRAPTVCKCGETNTLAPRIVTQATVLSTLRRLGARILLLQLSL